jgi:hypothetical protein
VTVAQSYNPYHAIFWACTLLVATIAPRPAHTEDAPSADDAYLDALQGDWETTGTLMGKPVTYHARGERVLQRGFLGFT